MMLWSIYFYVGAFVICCCLLYVWSIEVLEYRVDLYNPVPLKDSTDL